MKGFDTEDYREYFQTEKVEIVRWDKMEFNSVHSMFLEEPLNSSAKTLMEHVKRLSAEELEKLDKELCFKPELGAINRKYQFHKIINFIDTYVTDEDFIMIDYDGH